MEPVKEPTQPHSTEAIWNRVNEQQKSIGEIQANVASLAQRVEGGFSAVMAAIERIDKPADTKGWVGLIAGLVLVLGSIGLLVVSPMQQESIKQDHRQWEMNIQLQYERGYQQALRDRHVAP